MKNKIVVAFLGTDGSGKSTVIHEVTDLLNVATHYEHMRPNYLPSLAVFLKRENRNGPAVVCTTPHAGQSSGFIGSLIRLNYYFIDYTWGYYRKIYRSNGLCLFDRYYYDYLIDPKRGCIDLPQWIIKFYGFFVPRPDLIICLGTDAEKIFKRKPELPMDEIERQVRELKHFAQSQKNAVWIDTGCSIEETVNNAMNVILNRIDHRFAITTQ